MLKIRQKNKTFRALLATFIIFTVFAQNIFAQCDNSFLSPQLAVKRQDFDKSVDAAVESALKHRERNKALKEQIDKKAVMRISVRAGNYLFKIETAENAQAAGKKVNPGDDFLVSKVINARALLSAVINKSAHHQKYSEIEKQRLVAIAEHIDLLVVKNRYTLHSRGPFGHARRGTYGRDGRLNDSVIWIGEFSIAHLSTEKLALVLLDEAQHILFPFSGHQSDIQRVGMIEHNPELFAELVLLAKRNNELPTEFFCDLDMFSLSLQFIQNVSLEQKLSLKLEAKLEQRFELKLSIPEYRTRCQQAREVWYRANKKGRVFEYINTGKYDFSFKYAVVHKEDYIQLEDFGGNFKEIFPNARGMTAIFLLEGQYYILVDGDAYPDEYIKYIAIHEYGELMLGRHDKAMLLEFAVAQKDKKLKDYAGWLLKRFPLAFAGVLTTIENMEDSALDISEISGNGLQWAEKMVNRFKCPLEIMEIIYVYQEFNDRAENSWEIVLQEIGEEIDAWKPGDTATFYDFLERLNQMVGGAIKSLIDDDNLDKVAVYRLEARIDSYNQAYIGNKLNDLWGKYKQSARLGKRAEVKELDSISKLPFLKLDMDLSAIITVLNQARDNSLARKLPKKNIPQDELVFLRLEEFIESGQHLYLEGESEGLTYINKEEFCEYWKDETGRNLSLSKLNMILKDKKTLLYKGKIYPLELLISSDKDAFAFNFLKVIFEKICKENEIELKKLVDVINSEKISLHELFLRSCNNDWTASRYRYKIESAGISEVYSGIYSDMLLKFNNSDAKYEYYDKLPQYLKKLTKDLAENNQTLFLGKKNYQNETIALVLQAI